MSVCFCARWLVPVLMAVPLMFVIGWFTSEPLQAQDVDAVQKRLLRAVKHRELSMEQATMMMRVLRDSTHQGQADRGRPPQGRQDQRRQDQGRQDQGRQDQGRRQPDRQNEGRPRQPNREGGPRQGSDRRSDYDQGKWWISNPKQDLEQRFDQLMQAIDYSVRAGQISEEDADHQRREAERWMESQHREGDHHEGEHNERMHPEELERMFHQRMREIEEAVRSGQISEEEADGHRRETERWFESQHRRERDHDHDEHGDRDDRDERDERLQREFDEKIHAIEEAVRSGEMSKEEAGRARMEMERWFEDQHRREREHGDDEREDDEREDDEREDDEREDDEREDDEDEDDEDEDDERIR